MQRLIKSGKNDGEVLDAIFLAALARFPSDQEVRTCNEAFGNAQAKGTQRQQLIHDVAWALRNKREFVELHGLDAKKQTLGRGQMWHRVLIPSKGSLWRGQRSGASDDLPSRESKGRFSKVQRTGL